MPEFSFNPAAPGTLLIVDDDAVNRAILQGIFSPYYQIAEAADGRAGLEMIREQPGRFCAVLLDVVMPEMDGIEVLRRLHEDGFPAQAPVFLVTADPNGKVTKEAYELGVMDVISKPVTPFVVLRRVQSVIELFQARRRLRGVVERQQASLLVQAEKIIRLTQGMVEALATAIEFRSEESGGHVRRIHDITFTLFSETDLGRGMRREEIDQIALAAILHDVGKIAIPDTILNKPGRLTPEEFEVMKTHTTQGALLLGRIPQLQEHPSYRYAADIALHHHERHDGRGYPEGLKGDEITPWSQAVSLADVYDALSCKRVYKNAFPREQVLEMIRGGACGAFHPELLRCFFSVEEELSQFYHKDEKGRETV